MLDLHPFTPPADRAAFQIAGRSPGCLLLHGFTGDTREMRPLGEEIAAQLGLAGYVPLWPGHGLPPQAMAGLHVADFLIAGRAMLDQVRAAHSSVVVIGFSMGAALAIPLIAAQPVAGFIALAPMLSIRNPLLPLTPLLRRAVPWIYPLRMASIDDLGLRADLQQIDPALDLDDPATLAQLKREIRLPTSILDELRRMQHGARRAASHLATPTLIVQGLTDLTLEPHGAQWLFDHLPALDKQIYRLAGAGHDLVKPANKGHAEVRRLVLHWLAERFP